MAGSTRRESGGHRRERVSPGAGWLGCQSVFSTYCDSKVIEKKLDMRLAYVNLKNDKGYTPLHISSMRREPAVIVSLLTKGASTSETTGDGQCAVSICRRLIQTKDYHAKIEQVAFARFFFPSEWKLHKLKQPQNLYWAFCIKEC
ncbi:Regulatory protein NPR4 [Dendrobium catenatum]|uniref:Regulatory protein NPR4 n=1 Tax=Dendrobium catenatum TaxID=906689 RepID=A0A2I0WDN2_9ASPA|nr:Regulatory protein NPR4 [Dendrobium catenatum]